MDFLERCVLFNKFKREGEFLSSYGSEDLEDGEVEDLSDQELVKRQSYELKNNWQWLSLRHERRLSQILNLIKNKNNSKNENSVLVDANSETVDQLDPKVFSSFLPNILSNYIYSLLVHYNSLHNLSDRVNKGEQSINNIKELTYNENDGDDNINDNKKEGDERRAEIEDRIKFDLLRNSNILVSNDLNESLKSKNGDLSKEAKDSIIMFCDISGFTHITELIERNNNSTNVAKLGQFLRDFFYPLVDLVHFFGGDIVQFSGDALLCLFNSNHNNNNDCDHNNSVNDNNDCNNNNNNNCNHDTNNSNNNNDTNDDNDSNHNKNKDGEDGRELFVSCLRCCEELHRTLNNYPLLKVDDSDNEHVCSSDRGNCDRSNDAGTDNGDWGESGNDADINKHKKKSAEKKIELHISCVYGKAAMRVVGGLFDRFESYVDGNALAELSELSAAATPSLTVVSESFRRMAGGVANFKLINDKSGNKRFYRFVDFNAPHSGDVVSGNSRHNGELVVGGRDMDKRDMALFVKVLSYFIPRYIYNKLVNNVYLYNNEIRSVTVVFINFQLNPNHPHSTSYNNGSDRENSSKEANKERLVKELMYVCQKGVYAFEGTLNKLIVDEKGLSVLAFLGFPPFFTENASFNAVLCSLNIFHNVDKFFNGPYNKSRYDHNSKVTGDCKERLVNVGIGISTGNVWCGILGNGDRREFTSIGDVVNLSNRLMSYSLKLNNYSDSHNSSDNGEVEGDDHKEEEDNSERENLRIMSEKEVKYKVIVDSRTFEECRDRIELIQLKSIKIKNKPNRYKIYTTTGNLVRRSISSSSLSSSTSHLPNCQINCNLPNYHGNCNHHSCNDLNLHDCNNCDGNGIFVPIGSNEDYYGNYEKRIMRELFGGGRGIREAVAGSRVVQLRCNDENENELLFSLVNSELEDRCADWSTLRIDYAKSATCEFEGARREVYSELVRRVTDVWFNSPNRVNYYYESVNSSSSSNNNNTSYGSNNGVNNYASYKLQERDQKLLLKELLEPKYHWFLDVLLDQPDSSFLYEILKLNRRRRRSSILRDLFLLKGPDNSEKQSLDSSGNEPLEQSCEAGLEECLDSERGARERSVTLGDILVLFERERRNLDEYVFSLIVSLNRFEDLVLAVNLGEVPSPLVSRLLEYSKRAPKKLVLVLVYNDFSALESLSPENLRNLKKNHFFKKGEISQLTFFNLTKPEIKRIILKLVNDDNVDTNTLKDDRGLSELVDLVYDNTNGIRHFVYSYLEYILSYFQNCNYRDNNNEDNNLEDNNSNDEENNNLNDNNEDDLHDNNKENNNEENKLEDNNEDNLKDNGRLKKLVKLVKKVGILHEKRIVNCFKHKIDRLEPGELFVLKLLTLLNQKITIEKLLNIIEIGDNKVQNKKICTSDNIREILIKLVNYNLITVPNDNGDDNLENSGEINENDSNDEEVSFVVNNRILKGLINDMIIVEEKLHIINNYVMNF